MQEAQKQALADRMLFPCEVFFFVALHRIFLQVHRIWCTTEFLEVLAGLIDIGLFIQRAEKGLQEHTVSFITRDGLHGQLVDLLNQPVGAGATFSHTVAQFTIDALTNTTKYGDIALAQSPKEAACVVLSGIRLATLDQMKDRFANRGILNALTWLDVSRWPLGPALDSFAKREIRDIYTHWEHRLSRHNISLRDVYTDLERIKTVWITTPKPVLDQMYFWRTIISQPQTFPAMHIFLRMCLALTPSDAVVESAFSRLRKILADCRVSLECNTVEQLLLIALDSEPWETYDFGPVWQMQCSNPTRIHFRTKRSDRGIKRKIQGEDERLYSIPLQSQDQDHFRTRDAFFFKKKFFINAGPGTFFPVKVLFSPL